MTYNWIMQTDPGARSHLTENNATLTRHRAASAHAVFGLAPILACAMTSLHAHRDMNGAEPPPWEADSRSDTENTLFLPFYGTH